MSELAEKDAIREVMAEYCFCLDNNRFSRHGRAVH